MQCTMEDLAVLETMSPAKCLNKASTQATHLTICSNMISTPPDTQKHVQKKPLKLYKPITHTHTHTKP